MKYKSFARIPKTYHGVTFNPGDTKDVNGYINDSRFVRVKEDDVKKKSIDRKKKSKNVSLVKEVVTENTGIENTNSLDVQSEQEQSILGGK